jgi:hypothetical protein
MTSASTFEELSQFTHKVAKAAEGNGGFVWKRKEGYHILFKAAEMEPYFKGIRAGIMKGQAGAIIQRAVNSKAIPKDAENKQLWETLVSSLEFSGIDFEHHYSILPSTTGTAEQRKQGTWEYTFDESIVLSHSLLIVPVMQHYGPLTPKLDLLKGPTKKLDPPQPLLAVGMIGDCVKGKFFDEIKEKAEKGDQDAIRQRDTLLNPERLQQKMCGLVKSLLETCRLSSGRGLLVDAVLVGSGAFGGSAKVLAQPFADSLNGGSLPFDNSKDEVNFFMFPPPKPEELTLEPMTYKVSLNPKKGLGAEPEAGHMIRVLVAGFDPISLAPHGVLNRAFSAEGQLSHATDVLERLSAQSGKFVQVTVPKGLAWESPAAFFAKPQEPKYKDEEGYDTVRFVPDVTLQDFGVKDGQDVQLVAMERIPPRVWNGDSFDGWMLSLNGVNGKTWFEVLAPPGKRVCGDTELDGIRATFKVVDIRNDGTIRRQDLEAVLKEILLGWPQDDIKDLLRAADNGGFRTSPDGRIDYNDFLDWLFTLDIGQNLDVTKGL